MGAAEPTISLSENAEVVIGWHIYPGSKSERINQIIDRYGMLLRIHRTEELLEISRNEWLSYCVAEWGDLNSLPKTSLNALVRIVADEMSGTHTAPTKDELREALDMTADLTLIDQLVIVEAVESRMEALALAVKESPATAEQDP